MATADGSDEPNNPPSSHGFGSSSGIIGINTIPHHYNMMIDSSSPKDRNTLHPNNNNKIVYKSNSQKSINWEGTPQNNTHKSVNNKNTGS